MSTESRKNDWTIKALVKLSIASLLALSLIACSDKTAEEYIQEAQNYAEQGDNRAAIVELKSAVQQYPNLAVARFELGKIYIDEKDFDSAEKELSRASDLGYPSNKVIPLLTQAYQRLGANVALADLEYDANSLTGVERLEVGYRRLQSLLQLDKTYDALDLIDELMLIDSASVYKGLIEAHRFVIDEDYETALARAEALHERAPLNRDILGFTAQLYMLNGKEKEAAAMYEEYVKVAPDAIELKFSLASMLVKQGELEKANIYIDELMKINDTNALLNHLKGVIYASYENYPEALAYSERAIQFGLTDPRVRLVAGFSAYRLNEFNKAVGHLSQIENLLADDHPGLRILAASQLRADMGSEASEILPRLTDIGEKDATLFSKTGYELIQEGNIEAAKEIIEQTDKISVTADDLTRLGILKLSVNDIGGLLNLEQAVEKSPESSSSRAVLASAYLSTSQIDKALDLAKEWQASLPNEVEGFILESEVLQKQQKYNEAKEVLNKVANFAPENTAYLVAMIRINLRLEDTQEALVVTEKLLQNEPQNVIGLASLFVIKLQQKQPETALERIKAMFEQDKTNQNLALLLARSALRLDDVKLSLDTLSSIEANRSAPTQFWSLKGTALKRDKQIDAAGKHYDLWAELFPNRDDAAISQLLLLESTREYDKALLISKDFLARKENLRISLLQAYFYTMVNDAENAKKSLASLGQKQQTMPFLRGVKARIALLENRPADAVDDAIAAYENNKKTDNLFIVLRALQLTGQSERSNEFIKNHTETFPNDMRAKLALASSLIKTDIDAAIVTYQEMLEVVPDNALVLNNLAYLLMGKNDLDKAEELAERAYTIQSRNVAIADTYAQVLVKQGELDQAIEIYNKVITDEVTNEGIVLNYIEALLRSGSTTIAKRRLESREFTNPLSQVRIIALKDEFDL